MHELSNECLEHVTLRTFFNDQINTFCGLQIAGP
jgi:hypothetical protein